MLQVSGWGKDAKPIDLPKATAPPAPAPPSLAAEPPLSSHEVFGFAPYWTLTQSTGFDVGGMTTLAYFSIGVNPDGSLDESGTGWDGYQSQDLANLVTRAHAAGVRVVLTVNCFDQTSLNQLTSSSTAPATLSAALLQAIEAKNLDGVNLDFEGEGSADQVGLTNLVTQVSAAIHAANPHYQVTMDTYASSAGDPNGFYDIPALAPAVDAFFVMAYQLNLQASPTPASPLTSAMFSDLTTAEQYSAAVPADKVIMGVPYYGYSWPTSNGTMAAQATGPATPIGDGQIMASGNPVYWDSVTDTAWTSYQVGSQWYEDYFEDPSSLYLVAQMSQFFDLGGLGIWALGMDGNNAQMLAALDGFAPAAKDGLAGPTATVPTTSVPTSTTSTTAAADAGSTTTSTTAATGAGSTTTSTTGAASTSGNGSTTGASLLGGLEGPAGLPHPPEVVPNPHIGGAVLPGSADRLPDRRPDTGLPRVVHRAGRVGLRHSADTVRSGGRAADGLCDGRSHLHRPVDAVVRLQRGDKRHKRGPAHDHRHAQRRHAVHRRDDTPRDDHHTVGSGFSAGPVTRAARSGPPGPGGRHRVPSPPPPHWPAPARVGWPRR